ncbi:MAG TPA: hypothetical protein VG291_18655 [Xanthobacteraceae bacterium]|nr:hypothetical protein [Xanthobacteraceae bacterium]
MNAHVERSATPTRVPGNSRVRTAESRNREKTAVKLGLISAAIFELEMQPLNVSEIFLAYIQPANGISAIWRGDRKCFAA